MGQGDSSGWRDGPGGGRSFVEERAQDLVENAADLIQSVDVDGRFLLVNRRWREVLGYSEADLGSLRLFALIHPEHRAACEALFTRLLEGEELPVVETVFVARDGRSVELAGKVTLRRDATGRPTATRGIFRDVTAERAAQRRIDALARQTRAIVENAPAGMALYRPDGQCIEANEALARAVGAPRQRVVELNFRRIPSWRDSGMLDAAETCLRSGAVETRELWLTTTFGKRVFLRSRFVPVDLEGGRHLLFLAEDLTEEKWREERLVAHQRRMREIHALAADLAAQTDLDRVLQTAIDRVRDLVGAEFGAIVRMDPETGRPREAHPSNYPVDRIPAGTEVEGRGGLGRIARGETVATPRVTGEPGFEGWPAWHPTLGPMIGVPVRDRERVAAMLLVGRRPEAPPFEPEDREVVETVASLSAVAMRVAAQFGELQELNRRLAEQAATDPLMGIGNRRAFEEQIALLHAGCHRYGMPYGVIMADVDRFKLYNDRYGHPAGDRVLAAVARLLSETIRASDRVFRYGGEELVMVMPQQTLAGTAAAAERLRRCLERAALPHHDNPGGVVTVSFGVAAFEPAGDGPGTADWREVVRLADEGLYAAKRGGRNRVEAGGIRSRIPTGAPGRAGAASSGVAP